MDLSGESIQCLYLEDDPGDRATYPKIIKRAWEAQNKGVPFAVTGVATHDEAIKIITENPGNYQLFVADLVFGPKKDQQRLGMLAIAEAHQADPNLAILAFSYLDDNEVRATAIAKGADDFYSKQWLIKQEPQKETLGAMIVRILEKPDTITPILEESYIRDLPLTAVLETIDKDTVSRLVFKILGQRCRKIEPFFVRSGLSGAFVIRLDCTLDNDDKNPDRVRKLLMKASRDERQIRSELSKGDDVKAFPVGTFIPFAEARVVSSGGWHAIAVAFQKAETFLDWLIQSKTVREVDVNKTLKALLLGGGLQEVYARSARLTDKSPHVIMWETSLNPLRRARIQLACKELGPLAKTHGPSRAFEADLILKFIRDSKRIAKLDEEDIDLGTSICLNHGDLHCRNILVDENNKPNLVDPANIGNLHWAADIARLMVDLIVSGWDAGDKSHEWNYMKEWVEFSGTIIRGDVKEHSGNSKKPNDRVHAALSWLRMNLSEIHKVEDPKLKPEWEFKAALAVEFMRAACRQDLPSPKRVLGLIAACDALREAAATYAQQKKSK
jgi:CheY-like chemotaxis protein